MAELLLELYSEEIPPQLQIAARSQIKQFIENSLKEINVKYKELSVYSSPTRLTIYIKELTEKIKLEAKEIKGPKVGSSDQVIQGFLKAKNVSEKNEKSNSDTWIRVIMKESTEVNGVRFPEGIQIDVTEDDSKKLIESGKATIIS